MNRRISDLLNSYGEQELNILQDTPLSSERIKELTMSRINHKENKRRTLRGTLSKVLIAAATVSMLTLTAAAAEHVFGAGDWFRGILNTQLKEDQQFAEENDLNMTIQETISQNQIDLINELGDSTEGRSITSEGTTLTITASYADPNVMHIYLKAEAPEGVILPDGILYQFFDYNADNWDILKRSEPESGNVAHSMNIQPLPDANPRDNLKDFHITIYNNEEGLEFNRVSPLLWHITGIYEQVVDVNGDEDGFQLLAPGDFTFDIGHAKDVEVQQLDVSGLTYGGNKSRSWTHSSPCHSLCQELLTGESDPETGLPIHRESWQYEVTAKSLSISPLSAQWACDFTCSNPQMSCSLDFKIVMKDGTSPLGKHHGGGGGIGDYSSFGTVIYETPIDLSQIDYIQIGDEELGQIYRLTIPE